MGHGQFLPVCNSILLQLNVQGSQGWFCPFAREPTASLTHDLPEARVTTYFQPFLIVCIWYIPGAVQPFQE